jgi:hypothetical protein
MKTEKEKMLNDEIYFANDTVLTDEVLGILSK